jgi:hypothetical protein
MRHIPPKATFRPDNGVLKAVEGSDEHAVRWFDMIQLTRKLQLNCYNFHVSLTNILLFSLLHRRAQERRLRPI